MFPCRDKEVIDNASNLACFRLLKVELGKKYRIDRWKRWRLADLDSGVEYRLADELEWCSDHDFRPM